MTKKINRDHAQKKYHPLMENDAIVSHLSELLTPSIFNQEALFRHLGLRNRILNLSLMTAAILTLLWRDGFSDEITSGNMDRRKSQFF
jgi:hypothetical protein